MLIITTTPFLGYRNGNPHYFVCQGVHYVISFYQLLILKKNMYCPVPFHSLHVFRRDRSQNVLASFTEFYQLSGVYKHKLNNENGGFRILNQNPFTSAVLS